MKILNFLLNKREVVIKAGDTKLGSFTLEKRDFISVSDLPKIVKPKKAVYKYI